VEQRENAGRDANADRENSDDDDRKPRTAPELPDRIFEIVHVTAPQNLDVGLQAMCQSFLSQHKSPSQGERQTISRFPIPASTRASRYRERILSTLGQKMTLLYIDVPPV
jgi:hypothetical protein